MQKILPINNIGASGLNTDVSPWELGPEFFTDCKNLRVKAGYAASTGGHSVLATVNKNPFNPGFVVGIKDQNAANWVIAGRQAVMAYNGSNWGDISISSGYSSIGAGQEFEWSGCIIGNILVMSHPQDFPQYWPDRSISTRMLDLIWDSGTTWRTKSYHCKAICVHKNFLFALGMEEGGVELPDTYRWSHPADINGLPPSWDESDHAFLAGKAALGGNGGAIVTGLTMRDSFVIYSENAINVLDYTGDEFVWRRRELSSTIGLSNARLVIEVQGGHYFMSNGDIFFTDGNSIKSIATDKVKRRVSMYSSHDNFNRSYVLRNSSESELWFCVPEANSDNPDTAFVFNYESGSWSIRDLHDDIAHASYGNYSQTTKVWSNQSQQWGYSADAWSVGSSTDGLVGVVGASTTRDVYLIDQETSVHDYDCFLERISFPLEGVVDSVTVTRAYLNVDGVQPLSVQFGAQPSPASPVAWGAEHPFMPGVDRKVDVRVTGPLISWRIKSTGREKWRMSGMVLEYSKTGQR